MSEIIIQKVFLEIPFEQINYAKENKLCWSPEEKKWAICSDHKLFKYICAKYKIVNIKVPFADKHIAKENMAKWNTKEKTWQTFNGNTKLYDYMDDNIKLF